MTQKSVRPPIKIKGMKDTKQPPVYSIVFAGSFDGSGTEFDGWSLGINATPRDSRDTVSQYVMAHRDSSGSAGHWVVVEDGDASSISFVSSAHGGDKQFSEYSLGINALPKDKRDSGSQFVMAHSDVCGCNGRWRVGDTLEDGTHVISFISSAHGGDKQFAGWYLGVNAEPCDSRDDGSQYLMAHSDRQCAGKWRLQPASSD